MSTGNKSVFVRTLKSARLGLLESQYEVGLMYANGIGTAQNFEQALAWIRQAAERGFVPAQYLLGTRCASGIAVERDEHQAFSWFLKAAEQGHSKAYFRLGKLHAKARPDAAYRCYLKAAEQGVVDAQFALGQVFASGQGVEVDAAQALYWYELAATQGSAAAQCALAGLYAERSKPDLDLALLWYRRAAQQCFAPAQVAMELLELGHLGRAEGQAKRKRGTPERRRDVAEWVSAAEHAGAFARYCFGRMCEQGWGVPQDMVLAEDWYLRAAKQGEVHAQRALANLMTSDREDLAVDWYMRAAEQGDQESQYALGRIFSTAKGVARDGLRGLHWYVQSARGNHDAQALQALGNLILCDGEELARSCLRLAAEQGAVPAQFTVGQWYATGQGVEKNMAQAFEWHRRSAEQGYAPAQCVMGTYYLEGREVAYDLVLAGTWLQKAADQGDAKAQWKVGSLYASGGGELKKDLKQAFLWCQKAADQGFVPALATLGVLFARIKNYAQAVRCLQKAAAQGDPEAQYNLALMYFKGQGAEANPKLALDCLVDAAEQGVVSAQARLGLMYATGDAVALDPIEAHKWLMLAAEGGDKAGRVNCARSEAGLGLMQVAEAQRRVAVWRRAERRKLSP